MELREGLAIGSYRLVSPAGTGGMAEVWQAYHPRLRRYVAIKFLSSRFADDSTYLDRFLHEAQAISRLDHPHILTIYDFGEQDGWTYMVSPFVGGGTLASRLRRGPWAVDEAVSVLEPLASALDYAHSEGIVHRDVKPSNVLFTERDRLVLSDFGIARMIERSTLLTQAGLVIGTPMYMSPEQADGQPVTGASDRYSLGVVAYEMLTGRPPFMAETPLALLRAHIDKPLPPPRTLNPALSEGSEAALSTLLAKDPADRFGSGLDFVAALHATTHRSRLMAPPADLHTPTRIMETDDASSVRLGEAPGPASLVDPTAILPDAATASSPADTPGPGSIASTAALPTVPAPPIPAGPTRRGSGTPAQRPTDPDETQLLPARRFSRRQVVVGLGALTFAGVGAGVLVLTPRALEPAQPTQAPTAPVPAAPAPAISEAPAVAALPSPTPAPLTSAPPSPSPVVADASPVLRRTMPIENDTGLYLSTMALSPDGQVLATGSTNGLISLWRVDDGSEIRTFNGVAANTPTSTIFKIRFSPDGSILAAGTSHGVQVWDVASGRSIGGHNSQALGTSSYASAVAFSPDGELVAGGFRDKITRVWRTSSGAPVHTLTGHDHFVLSTAFSPDGQLLATGSDDETIKIWRVADGTEVRTMSDLLPGPGNRQSPDDLAFSTDGQHLAVAVHRQGVQLWRVTDGMRIATFAPKAQTVAFLHGSQLLVSGGGDGLQLWRPVDASLLRTLSDQPTPVRYLATSADGQIVASAVTRQPVQIWQVPG